MSGFEWPHEWNIANRKVSGYLLNAEHPVGGAKAMFFIAAGFDHTKQIQLMESLLRHPTPKTFVRDGRTPLGDLKLIFEGPLLTDMEGEFRVRTVWQVDGAHAAHFVTAVPLTD